jgi:glycerophosphoryl diester phosphodiesterase
MVDLVARLTRPINISHRGGPLRFAEHSMEGYRRSLQDGFVVEQDLLPNADGVPVCNHDTTVDRTWVGGSGAVATKTSDEWSRGTLEPPIPGGDSQRPVFWHDVITELGGRGVLMPELKNPTTHWTLAQRTALFDDIVARSLHRSVVVQCFSYSVVLEAVAKGIRGLMLGSTQTAEQLAADGVWGVGLDTRASAAYVDQCRAAGLVVLIYTIDDRATRDTWIDTVGADGLFSNDIWWTSRRFPGVAELTARTSTDLPVGVPWPGMKGNSNQAACPDPRGLLVHGGWSNGVRNLNPLTNGFPGATADTQGVPLAFAGPRGPAVLCRARLTYTADATDQTRWGGLFWGDLDPEVGYSDDAVQPVVGYHLLFRRNGELVLFRKDGSAAAVQLVTTDTAARAPAASGPAIAAGAEAEVVLELEVGATDVVGRVLWGGSHARTVTIADATHRPTAGYFQVDCNGQVVQYRDVVVRGL